MSSFSWEWAHSLEDPQLRVLKGPQLRILNWGSSIEDPQLRSLNWGSSNEDPQWRILKDPWGSFDLVPFCCLAALIWCRFAASCLNLGAVSVYFGFFRFIQVYSDFFGFFRFLQQTGRLPAARLPAGVLKNEEKRKLPPGLLKKRKKPKDNEKPWNDQKLRQNAAKRHQIKAARQQNGTNSKDPQGSSIEDPQLRILKDPSIGGRFAASCIHLGSFCCVLS